MPAGRHQHLARARCPRVGLAGALLWQTSFNCQRQPDRVHQPDDSEVGSENRVEWHYIDPGKPRQNAFIESLNGSLRDELLNEELFDGLGDARRKLAVWRYDYDNVRPHAPLGNRTPEQARLACLQDRSRPPRAPAPVAQHENQIVVSRYDRGTSGGSSPMRPRKFARKHRPPASRETAATSRSSCRKPSAGHADDCPCAQSTAPPR